MPLLSIGLIVSPNEPPLCSPSTVCPLSTESAHLPTRTTLSIPPHPSPSLPIPPHPHLHSQTRAIIPHIPPIPPRKAHSRWRNKRKTTSKKVSRRLTPAHAEQTPTKLNGSPRLSRLLAPKCDTSQPPSNGIDCTNPASGPLRNSRPSPLARAEISLGGVGLRAKHSSTI
ncbi:hypothetical protein EJ06DRAFT_116372 [Trichodelitschia bisporula]|uniref:Uncharacterized protein n=1 Tax=Trichodelitschia bisporula TaxID=703511 RepID=A0A6G1HPM8_9PEZI|nr:hypothetical protein EJ06DRAFT_116372 [Trichodelitschia bisporula]